MILSIYGIRLTPKIRGTPDFRGRGPRNQGYLFAKILKFTNVKCQKILKYHSLIRFKRIFFLAHLEVCSFESWSF